MTNQGGGEGDIQALATPNLDHDVGRLGRLRLPWVFPVAHVAFDERKL